MPMVKIAFKIPRQGEADKHADRRRSRHRHEKPDETEKRTESEEGEHQPDRMQADAFADKLRLQDVAFDELAGKEHDERQKDINIVRPELHDGDADGEDEADHGSDIGNEADETRKRPISRPKFKPTSDRPTA